jgi:hypothetical protein
VCYLSIAEICRGGPKVYWRVLQWIARCTLLIPSNKSCAVIPTIWKTTRSNRTKVIDPVLSMTWRWILNLGKFQINVHHYKLKFSNNYISNHVTTKKNLLRNCSPGHFALIAIELTSNKIDPWRTFSAGLIKPTWVSIKLTSPSKDSTTTFLWCLAKNIQLSVKCN